MFKKRLLQRVYCTFYYRRPVHDFIFKNVFNKGQERVLVTINSIAEAALVTDFRIYRKSE